MFWMNLEFSSRRACRMSEEDIAALGGPSPEGIPTPNPVKGEWNFDDGTLKATIGNDLHYLNDSVANLYEFGTTGQGAFAAIPNINSKPAKVIHVPFTGGADAQDPTAKLLGLKMNHGILPNGGDKVNQWTMIIDLLWGDQAGSGSARCSGRPIWARRATRTCSGGLFVQLWQELLLAICWH
jgi:hypothetical protein